MDVATAKAQPPETMEENQNSLQESQQPENELAQEASKAEEQTEQAVETEPAETDAQAAEQPLDTEDTPVADESPAAEETPSTEDAQAEEYADSADDEEEDTAEEAAAREEGQFQGKTAEELKSLTDEELLTYMKEVAQITPVRKVRDAVAAIKAEVTERFANRPVEVTESTDETADGTESHVEIKQQEPSAEELALRAMLAAYDEAVETEKREAYKAMEANADAKSALLEKLTHVIEETQTNNPSKFTSTVKEIIAKWKSIGHVPAARRSINKQFHNLTEDFFTKLNIERDLRNLDMRHNLAEKVKLCEQAEALTTMPTTRKAFNQMQRLREIWKTIGPVLRSDSDAVWERFRAANIIVTENFRKGNDAIREQEKENYKLKLAICEEVEALLAKEMNQKEVESLSKKAQEYTTRWRGIGFAPKSVNDEIYKRFRQSIDKMHDICHAFHKEQNERFEANLRIKERLCEKAEAVMNSTDWRQTSDYLIGLQKEWKEVGPVAHKNSDAIWKRFRKACDTFFDNKQGQQKVELNAQAENLNKKRAIIEELKAYVAPADEESHLKDLKEIVGRWNSIGLVPGSDKGAVNKEFAALIGKQYDALHIDRTDAEIEQYRGKLEAMKAEGGDRFRRERMRLQAQIRQEEQEIETLENNIGFFAKSKNSDKFVEEFNAKIAKARAELEILNRKMNVANEIASR